MPAGAAAATTSGEPADPLAVVTPSAAATASVTANPIADFIRFFIGDGTADNPNAGILFGNGYSYTSYEGPAPAGPATAVTAA